MTAIGILGGTFDPVHLGHIFVARQALTRLMLDQVRFIPVNIPSHRDRPVATAEHRLAMLKLAVADQVNMLVDTRELDNADVSYTIISVRSLRREYPTGPLVLLMGDDAYSKIDGWKDWRQLLDYVHIVTIKREGASEADSVYNGTDRMKKHLTDNPAELLDSRHGRLYRLENDPVAISSTRVRQQLKRGAVADGSLPQAVIDYIRAHDLYQP